MRGKTLPQCLLVYNKVTYTDALKRILDDPRQYRRIDVQRRRKISIKPVEWMGMHGEQTSVI